MKPGEEAEEMSGVTVNRFAEGKTLMSPMSDRKEIFSNDQYSYPD